MINMEIRKLLNKSFKTEFDKNSLSPHNNIFKKIKRIRSAFTTNQIIYLENEFLKSPYVSVVSRKEIANNLNIPERAVKVWFQNRRMKEKKDFNHRPVTEFHHIETGQNGRFVNDQLSKVEKLQLNNNLCSHSVLPQPKFNTNLNESDNFLKKNIHKQVSNMTKNVEIKKKINDVMSRNFQNNTITSSSNEAKRNADLSLELLKKYKNHLHTNTTKNTIKTKTLQSKHSDVKKRKLNNLTTERKSQTSVPRSAPSIVENQQLISQIPSGYIPLYPQQHNQQYPSPGNFIWKAISPAEMSTPPMCDFVILPSQHTVAHQLSKSNVKKSQCSCNCHMNPSNMTTFSHENPLQYVIAVPFHKPPLQFRSSI